MDDRLDKKIMDGLGLTQQQFDILNCIYRLQDDGGRASPKAIQEEYKRVSGKRLMKANLFKVLKALRDKNFVDSVGFGKYALNYDGVEEALEVRKEEYERELTELDKLSGDVEEYFDRLKESRLKPVVEYYSQTPFFLKIAQTAKHTKNLYMVGRFANITYTPRLLNTVDRGECFRQIQDMCFVKKQLHVTYITSFDVDYIYRHALKTYGDPQWAYRECEMAVDGLHELANLETLDLIYINKVQGLHLVLPEKKEPSEVFLYLRDNAGEIIGGVYIKSPDTAKRAKEMFMREQEQGTNLKGKPGKRIIKGVKENLKEKYGKH